MRLGEYSLEKSINKEYVSIPAWCDWEGEEISKIVAAISVSIPAWCDWEPSHQRSTNLQFRVSIPAWCDWEDAAKQTLRGCFMFQFQLGAIGRLIMFTHAFEIYLFQFQLGAIGSE